MLDKRHSTILLVALTVLAVSAASPAAAQEEQATLTVSVSTPGGEAVGDATLTASWSDGSRTRTTAANGKAFISVPKDADVEISVDHPDYVRNAPLEVEDASEREESMTVYEKASARITVEDSNGPVSDAEVAFRKGGSEATTATTGDDGVAESGTIEAGTYSVRVSKAGYYVARESLSISGQAQESIALERGTVTLEVNVTDDHFDPPKPVEGATVDVSGSGSVTTQPAGIGRISVPVNSWTTLTVTKDGYESAEESHFVSEEDDQVGFSIQRTPAISAELLSERVVAGERISLAVTDEYGDPVSGATVLLDGSEVAETDESGQAVVSVDETGEYEVVVQKDSLKTQPKTVVGISPDRATEESLGTSQEGETELDALPVETPGFNVPVAMAALGLVALVALLRRRG